MTAAQGYVVGFLVDPSTDHVALIRKGRPEWQAGKLNGVGGHIEPGESPAAAMVREFGEETGAMVGRWVPMLTMPFPGAVITFYRCHMPWMQWPDLQQMTDEPLEVWRIGQLIGKRRRDMIPNLRWLLPLAAYTADSYGTFTLPALVAEAL